MAAAAATSIVASWPALGAGFQSDDFRWLWHARFVASGHLARIFTETLGFYRPFTELSWVVDLALGGPRPLVFSLTNLALHIVVLALFAAVCARLAGRATAAAAVGLAALSHHYNVTAIVWVSGRGALLGAAAALVALWLWDRWCSGESGVAGYATALAALAVALGSYEAVVGLPLFMLLMAVWRGARLRFAAPGPLLVGVAYALARIAVGARQPWAPGAGYGYEIAAVLPNLVEYVGRALSPGTILLALLLAIALTAGAAGATARAAYGGARGPLGIGAAWFLIGVAATLPVPSRSNLYVYFAALGVHLVMGGALAAGFSALRDRQRRVAGSAAAIALLIVLVAWPFFAWDRNLRLTRQARLATVVIAEVRRLAPDPSSDECVVLIDDPRAQPTLHESFGADLSWLGAYVYDEEPSARLTFAAGPGSEAPCPRPLYLRFDSDPSSPGDGRLVVQTGASSG